MRRRGYVREVALELRLVAEQPQLPLVVVAAAAAAARRSHLLIAGEPAVAAALPFLRHVGLRSLLILSCLLIATTNYLGGFRLRRHMPWQRQSFLRRRTGWWGPQPGPTTWDSRSPLPGGCEWAPPARCESLRPHRFASHLTISGRKQWCGRIRCRVSSLISASCARDLQPRATRFCYFICSFSPL